MIDNLGDEVRLDANAKQALANKSILAEIIHELIPGFENIPVQNVPAYISTQPEIGRRPVHPGETNTGYIRPLEQENAIKGEGKAVFDVFFLLNVPGSNGECAEVYVNVEAQASEYKTYTMEQRAVYYMARLISSQYERDFSNSHYEKLKKVYSIWLIFDPQKQYRNSISTFSYQQKTILGTPKDDGSYDLAQAFFVRLSDDVLYKNSKMIGVLNTLFSKQVSKQDKKSILSQEYGVKVDKDLERSVDEMCNYSVSVLNKGLAEGRVRTIAELYVSGDISKDKALEKTQMSEQEFDEIVALLFGAGEEDNV